MLTSYEYSIHTFDKSNICITLKEYILE